MENPLNNVTIDNILNIQTIIILLYKLTNVWSNIFTYSETIHKEKNAPSKVVPLTLSYSEIDNEVNTISSTPYLGIND